MDQTQLDRDALLGVLALQVDLVTEDQLAAAYQHLDPDRTLGDVLVQHHALTPALRDALEPMVDAHIQRHGGSAAQSLAALSSTDQVRSALSRIGRPSGESTTDSTALHAGSPRATTEPTRTIAASDDHAPFEPPRVRTSDRFRVLRPHARGGLGQVYVARDNELGRQVALKEILADKAAHPALRQRFMLEAEINGNLEHPGIVPVYGLGTYADGRPFYAMRFIEGDSLKEAIERFHTSRLTDGSKSNRAFDSLEFRQLLRRFVDVCNAVGYAHSRGVLHRDLKPANVMLGQYGETLIIDWGLAKATGRVDQLDAHPTNIPLSPLSGSSLEQTEAGAMLGTPAFMSPEQANGQIDELGSATDLYSLGATLYNLLTGRPPVVGPDIAEVLARVRDGRLDPPRSVVPEIPRPLEAVCLKALSLRPDDRYPTAKSLADDVERWLADEAVTAANEPWLDRLRRWSRRHRLLVAVAATATLASLAGLGVVAAVQTNARNALASKNEALASAIDARGRALDKANQRIDLALEAIGQFREAVDTNVDVQNRPENAPLRNQLLETPVTFFRELRDQLKNDSEARPEDRLKLADAQLELARLTRDIGNQAAALEAAHEAVATLDSVATASPPTDATLSAREKLLDALALQSTLLTSNGQGEQAQQALDRGVQIGEELVKQTGSSGARIGLAKQLSLSASADSRAERTDAAKSKLARSRQLLDELTPAAGDHDQVSWLRADLLSQIASLQARQGSPVEAARTIQSTIDLMRPFTDAPNPSWKARTSLSKLRFDLGSYYDMLERPEDALTQLRTSLTLDEAMLEERPANLAVRLDAVDCLRNIADLEEELGRGESALQSLKKATGLLEPARRENPRNLPVLKSSVSTLQATGGALYGLGRVEDSLQSFEDALPLQQEIARIQPEAPVNRADVAGNLYNIALLRKLVGKVDESLKADGQSLAIRRELAKAHPEIPAYRLNLAASLGNIGTTYEGHKSDHETAATYFRAAESILARLVAEHPDVPAYAEYLSRSRANLATVLDLLGQSREALATRAIAEPYLEQRVRAQPQIVQARIELAGSYLSRASAYFYIYQYDEIDRLCRLVIETLDAIPPSGQSAVDAVDLRVGAHKSLGASAEIRGRLPEAVQHYTTAISIGWPDRPATIPSEELRGRVWRTLYSRASVLARLGRLDEARADWASLSTVNEPGAPDPAPFGPILLRAWSGDPQVFLAEANAAIRAGLVNGDWMANFAQAACTAMLADGLDLETRGRLEQAALSWLDDARRLGAFQRAGAWTALLGAVYAPISDRPEFQQLLADLQFPSYPFTPQVVEP